MSIQAQVEGLGTLEFPDGTDPAVVQATVKKTIASRGTGASAAPPAGGRAPIPRLDTSSMMSDRGVKKLPGVDYKTGLTFQDMTALDQADNPREGQKYLESVYGKDNVKAGSDGSLIVMKDGKQIGAYGGPTAKRAMADATASVPMVTGMAIGAAKGAQAGEPFGPWGIGIGAVGGAILGAVTGKSLTEAQKALEGRLDKTPAETVKAYKDTAVGAVVGELTGTAVGKAASRVARGPVPELITGAKDSAAMTDRMLAGGARPPAETTMPSAKHIQFIEAIASKAVGPQKAQAAANAAYIEKRMASVLEDSGIPKDQVAPTLRELGNADSKIPTAEVGEHIKTAVTAHKEMIQGQVNTALADTQTLLNAQVSRLDKMTGRLSTEGLAEDVAGGIKASRRDFGTSMSKIYNRIDGLVGDQPLVPTMIINKEAQAILRKAPQSVQAQLTKELGDIGVDVSPKGPKMISFSDAQRIRTILRERSDETALTRGATQGEFAKLAGAVDHSIQAAASNPVAAPAVKMLNQADALYGKGIRRFDDATVKRLVKDMQAGLPPNPEEVAAKIVQPGQEARVKEIRRLVGPEAWKKVAGADYTNLITGATDDVTGAVSGLKLLRSVTERKGLMTEIYGARTAGEITDLARAMASRDGGLPVESLGPGQVRDTLARLRDEEARLDDFMKKNALSRLTRAKENPEAAYAWLTQPNNGTALASAIKLLGENSPEVTELRQVALKKLLTNTKMSVASGLGPEALTNALKEYTPQQQALLFPHGMADDLHLLGKEVSLLTKKLSDESKASMAAGAILTTPFMIRVPMQVGLGVYQTILSQPKVIRYLSIGLRSPETRTRIAAREMLKNLIRTGSLAPTMGGDQQQDEPQPQRQQR
jgi:hypothetical protein